MAIFQSASKISFLLLTVALCAALFCGRIEGKDFMYICGMAFAYYFGTNKPSVQGISGIAAPLVRLDAPPAPVPPDAGQQDQ